MNFLQKSIDKTIFMWYNTIQIVIVLLGVPMQFIKNDMNFNYDIITSGDFQLESISAAHADICFNSHAFLLPIE